MIRQWPSRLIWALLGELVIALNAGSVAYGQGVGGDLLAGKLVDPKVGQWAWYDLTDKASSAKYVIRQAIVGQERVDKKDGFWLELEVVPSVGYKTIFRMLVTGPADDPKNIRALIRKYGPEPAEKVEVPDVNAADANAAPKRKSLGMEDISTKSGVIRAEHLALQNDARNVDMWVSDAVKPAGIVRVTSPEGEMVLRNTGFGGPDGKTVLTEFPLDNEVGSSPSRDGGRKQSGKAGAASANGDQS